MTEYNRGFSDGLIFGMTFNMEVTKGTNIYTSEYKVPTVVTDTTYYQESWTENDYNRGFSDGFSVGMEIIMHCVYDGTKVRGGQ